MINTFSLYSTETVFLLWEDSAFIMIIGSQSTSLPSSWLLISHTLLPPVSSDTTFIFAFWECLAAAFSPMEPTSLMCFALPLN